MLHGDYFVSPGEAQQTIAKHAALIGAASIAARAAGYRDLAVAYADLDSFLILLSRRSMATGSDIIDLYRLNERIECALRESDLTVLL